MLQQQNKVCLARIWHVHMLLPLRSLWECSLVGGLYFLYSYLSLYERQHNLSTHPQILQPQRVWTRRLGQWMVQNWIFTPLLQDKVFNSCSCICFVNILVRCPSATDLYFDPILHHIIYTDQAWHYDNLPNIVLSGYIPLLLQKQPWLWCTMYSDTFLSEPDR